MANFIGNVLFHTMTPPDFGGQKSVYYARAGVDGHSVWRAGIRGQVFNVRTTADYADLNEAHDAFNFEYKGELGNLVTMEWEDGDVTASLAVIPLEVKHPGGLRNAIYKCLVTQGGLLGGTYINSARVHADWTLLSLV